MTDSRFVRCRQCGALNEPRAIFCSRCGSALSGAPQRAKRGPSRRLNSTSLALGAALLLVLVIVAFVLYTVIARSVGGGERVASYSDQQGIPATLLTTTTVQTDANGVPVTAAPGTDSSEVTTTTEPPLMVRPKATVASSALEGTSTASFQATNLLDNDPTTAWIEGTKGPGLGEWVRFEFAEPTVIVRIDVANGYQKDASHYVGNPRVRLLKVDYSSGATQLVELSDTPDLQFILPPNEAVDWIRMVIVSIYPGKDNQDTALSEVHLYEKTG